jgi:hypothetical protein
VKVCLYRTWNDYPSVMSDGMKKGRIDQRLPKESAVVSKESESSYRVFWKCND